MNPRTLLLWGGLAATLGATWYAAGMGDAADDDALQAVMRADRTPMPPAQGSAAVPTAISAPISGPVTRMGDARMAAPRAALMPVHSWRPPAPPPVAVQAPPPAKAPPLPFRYVGRLDDGDGAPTVFLVEGAQARPHVVRTGDRLREYEVQAITERGVTFVYLPLQQKQQLLFGNPN